MKTPFRFIPEGATEQRDEESTAVAYLYTNSAGHPAAVMYSGKRGKPDSRYYYRSEAQRAEEVAKHAANVRSRENYRRERRETTKAARNAANSLEIPADGYLPAPAVAAFLRQCLKEAFPGVKFSVRSDRSLNVDWTDGPATEQVEAIAKSFAGSYFDGMIDYEGSIYHAIDGQKVSFGCSYVFTGRTLSAEALRIGAEAMQKHYDSAEPVAEIIEGAHFITVKPNPDFPGAISDRHEVELMEAPHPDRCGRAVNGRRALETWFDLARPFERQPSPTFQRFEVLGTDGYGNTALDAADGGPTGRGYPDPSAKDGTGRTVPAPAPAPVVEEAPRLVACQVIDLMPHLEARANAARRLN